MLKKRLQRAEPDTEKPLALAEFEKIPDQYDGGSGSCAGR
jgi:hypothetical protein